MKGKKERSEHAKNRNKRYELTTDLLTHFYEDIKI